jgi:hypothetical protein
VEWIGGAQTKRRPSPSGALASIVPPETCSAPPARLGPRVQASLVGKKTAAAPVINVVNFSTQLMTGVVLRACVRVVKVIFIFLKNYTVQHRRSQHGYNEIEFDSKQSSNSKHILWLRHSTFFS